MADFSKFDEMINKAEMAKDIAEAIKNGGTGDYPELEDGIYMTKLEKMELAETKDGRPMFKAMFRIIEGEHKKQCIFMNRVVYGTKNDANMISSTLRFLADLEPTDDVGNILFDNYSQLSELILDVFENVADALEYEVEYKKDSFNNVSILEAYEV